MFTRFNGNVVPFANDATSTNRTVFGGTTQSDLIDDNLNTNFKKGWEIVGLNDNPTREDFNAMGYTNGYLISYLYQAGIPEYNATQNYLVNSIVIASDGNLYKSLTGTSETPNIGTNPLSDVVNWKSLNSDFVSLTGDQTIAGIKTFSSFPITPSLAPTTIYQVANKKYVDDKTWKDIFHKNTPVAITSWSYVTTTITLNVASHTFVAGEYIEVSGLTSTTYPANGIHLITSVTSTTIVFTLSATPTGTTGTTSATVRGYVTINGRVSESIGVNQTWQDVTASRVAGITYTNSTGKPISVSISIETVSDDVACTLTVQGVINSSVYNAANGILRMFLTCIVPSDGSYRFDKYGSGTYSIQYWVELR